jgi:hypothetical protein
MLSLAHLGSDARPFNQISKVARGGDKEDKAAASSEAYFRDSPLNELALRRPSEVMSRYSMSATNVGSTHVALDFLMGLVSLDFGLTTVSSCLRI